METGKVTSACMSYEDIYLIAKLVETGLVTSIVADSFACYKKNP